MAKANEKLAEALSALGVLQKRGQTVIRSGDLSRTHQGRLLKAGFIRSVMKGWYIPSRPDETVGESTAWYASYWAFCSVYLHHRFDEEWCLSPEQSVLLYAGNMTIPRQLLVRAPKGRNKVTTLPHDTSVFDVRAAMPVKGQLVIKDGLRLFSLQAALIAISADYYTQQPIEMRAVLSVIKNSSELLPDLLDGGKSVVAGRLAGAFRNIGRDRIADEILDTMRAVGHDVREKDPFDNKVIIGDHHETSPYAQRIRLLWEEMRQDVLEHFPPQNNSKVNIKRYMKDVEDIYVTDAYHSLSIEGYRVTPELIERVRSGAWNPDAIAEDQQQRDAMAARGYWQAFQAVKASLEKVLKGENAGGVADKDLATWHRELFGPSVNVGILDAASLAGYRSMPVYIRRSMHTPPAPDVVRDLMPVLFDLLGQETEPSVRIVLGHFIFVYIHPYIDGNGRLGRFMMNVMMASGGYAWTVVPVEKRDEYMAALEAASVEQNIVPFTQLIAGLVE